MGRQSPGGAVIILAALLFVGLSCDARRSSPTTSPGRKTIASLVPAATDLLVGMGAADHLVAVSNWDTDRVDIRGLPRVGDYQTVDWEKLSALKSSAMIIQIKPDRMPAGFTERAAAFNIRLVNIAIDRLDDVLTAFDKLGEVAGEPEKANTARLALRARLDAVVNRAKDHNRVSAIIAIGPTGFDLAGPSTYLDDLLTLAGGANVAAGLSKPYPSVDREMMESMKPVVIIQLMPNASPQEKRKAAAVWASMPTLPAVAAGRITVIDDWHALLPGAHVGELAERFSDAILSAEVRK